jgi:chemotaxis protein MotB
MRYVILCAAGLLSACGMSQADHLRALDEQAQRYQDELAKSRARIESQDQAISDKDKLIQGLENEVQDRGGDLDRIKKELGARTTELAATKGEVEQLRRLREQAEREKAQFKALTDRFKGMIDSGQLSVVKRGGRMMLKLPDEILFPSGSKRLKKGGRAALKEVVRVLIEVGGKREYVVAGHTDNVPLRRGARFKDNWELSTARANEVVHLMIDEGVPPEQLAAAGYASHDPIASNDTPEGRQQNRRLEIILMPNLEPIEL